MATRRECRARTRRWLSADHTRCLRKMRSVELALAPPYDTRTSVDSFIMPDLLSAISFWIHGVAAIAFSCVRF